ncbi:hypothetical protein C8R43DRAFT_1143352 [Mycena crocata]|nr:hypothetical protein C8R43DRAFT_1143352 [Mycena crocata]
MPREGTAARRRAREGGPPAKPGKVGWVHGTKIPFFVAYVEEFLAAVELRETSAFYEKMGHLYIGTYGWNTDWADDLPTGQTQASDIDPDEDVDSLLPEVAEARAAYFAKLKGKIGVWYKAQYGSGAAQKKQKVLPFTKLFDSRALEPPEPEKPRAINFYSRRFYEERVSARVNARWAVVSRQPDPPKFITVVNTVTKETWLSETPAFRAEVEAALEAEHAAAMEAYSIAISGEAPTTPDEYNIALNNAAYYVQPFADGMANRFAMNVSILICGPVPDRGGRIEVRSIHAGKSLGALPRIWSDFDRGGFDAAQRSFIEFSHHCFTEEQCRARALDGVSMADESSGSGHMLSIPPRDEEMLGEQGESTGGADNGPPPTNEGHDPDPPPSDKPSGRNDDRDSDDEDADATPPPPIIGKALARKMAEMPVGERESYMRRLSRMHPDLVERECNMARNDLMLARLAKGMSGDVVMALGSDDEEDEGEGAEGGEGDAGNGRGDRDADKGEKDDGAKRTRQRKKRAAPAGPPRQTRSRTTTAAPMSGSAAVSPPVLERPHPKPSWKGAEGRPDADPDTDSARDDAQRRELVVERREVDANTETPSTTSSASASASAELSGGANGTPAGPDGIEKGGLEGDGAEKVTMWDTQEMDGWSAEMRKAFGAFARGKAWGGGEWETMVRSLIALESAWGFPAKGLLSVPADEEKRPAEIPAFVRGKREWENTVEIATALGPRTAQESFSNRWWCWWAEAQPLTRIQDADWKAPADVAADEWKGIARMHGRNGILLYLAALLWWGEAAVANENESAARLVEWREAVEDVSAVLKEALKVVGPMRIATDLERSTATQPRKTCSKAAAAPDAAPANAKSKLRKRKNPDTPDTSAEKENEKPRKRLRSRR